MKMSRLRFFSRNTLRQPNCLREHFKWNSLFHPWNNSPKKVRTEDLSLSCFKKCCREFYKNKIRDFDPDYPHATLYMLFFSNNCGKVIFKFGGVHVGCMALPFPTSP